MTDATHQQFYPVDGVSTFKRQDSPKNTRSEAYYQELTEAFRDAAERYRRYCREETIEAALREHGELKGK